MLRACLSIFTILVGVTAAFGQATFAGSVLEVIDGRTVVVEASRTKVKVQLQFVETPEPDQPLYATIRDHLAKLVVGKVVEFRPFRINDRLTVGRIRVGGVDLSQQLLRDGAAWHEPPATSGQAADEALDYADQEAMAKAEKRGVWSIPGLKTPRQIRAEKQAELDRVEAAKKVSKPALVGVSEFQTPNRSTSASVANNWGTGNGRSGYDAWGDVFAGVGKETRGLQTYTDPQGRFDAIYTSAAFIEMDGGKVDRRVECRLILAYLNLGGGKRETLYAVGFRAIGPDYHFSNQKSSLTFMADKRNLPVGAPYHGVRGDTAIGSFELFFYRLTKPQLLALSRARSLEVRIDGMLGTVSADARSLFKELAATAN